MSVYDKIAGKFDERYSESDFIYVENFLSKLTDSNFSLEVGCGTFRWGKLFSGKIFGIDASFEMLKYSELKEKTAVAKAEELPFGFNLFNFVYIVNAFHQFEEKQKALKEIYRVLKHDSTLAIIIVDFYNPKYHWYIYDYFPKTYEFDTARFLSAQEMINMLVIAGFTEIKANIIHTTNKQYIGKQVFNDKFLKKHNTSQLALLSEEEYENGLKKIREEINKLPQKIFSLNIPVLGVTAVKK